MPQNWLISRLTQAHLPRDWDHLSAALVLHFDDLAKDDSDTPVSSYASTIKAVLKAMPKELRKEAEEVL